MTKRKFVLTICLAMMGVLGMKAQYGVVALHHEGNVTLYAGGLIQEAMDASVKGDTLYLSEGTFSGFTVSHDIVVLGSGEKTVLTGDITMTQNIDKDAPIAATVFCGLNLLKDLKINKIVVTGMTVQQCKMENFSIGTQSDYLEGKISDVKIEMCLINKLALYKNRTNGLEVIASKIGTITGDGAFESAVNFHYCNINSGSSVASASSNTYVNCILSSARYGTFINCLYGSSTTSNTTLMNSWKDTDWSFNDDMDCSFSDEELKSYGYISTEGSVVGVTGWQTPFTLEPFYPHVIDHSLDVDNINKTLKVTLKMNE